MVRYIKCHLWFILCDGNWCVVSNESNFFYRLFVRKRLNYTMLQRSVSAEWCGLCCMRIVWQRQDYISNTKKNRTKVKCQYYDVSDTVSTLCTFVSKYERVCVRAYEWVSEWVNEIERESIPCIINMNMTEWRTVFILQPFSS